MAKGKTYPGDKKGVGFSFGAGSLYDAAIDACLRCDALASDETMYLSTRDPYVAVVFAAASLEAFVNDMIVSAHHHSVTGVGEGTVAQFGVVGSQLLEDMTKSNVKLDLAHVVFAGVACPWGAHPYQDWRDLQLLRNRLLHMCPEGYVIYDDEGMPQPEYPPEIMRRLGSKGILATVEVVPWTGLIQTAGVARWACDVAFEMVMAFIGFIPEPTKSLFGHLAKPFSQLHAKITDKTNG